MRLSLCFGHSKYIMTSVGPALLALLHPLMGHLTPSSHLDDTYLRIEAICGSLGLKC